MRNCMDCVPAGKEPQADMAMAFPLMTSSTCMHTQEYRTPWELQSADSPNATGIYVAFEPFNGPSRRRSFLRIFPNKDLATSSIAQYAMLYMLQGHLNIDE